MALSSAQLGFILIYFIYGLSFFTMGISLLLEAWRSSSISERQVLVPLAVFGLMHGAHEWIEIVFLQGVWLKTPFPASLDWLRVTWLAASFVPLILFGVLSLDGEHHKLRILAVLAFPVVFLILAAYQGHTNSANLVHRVDALARYVLALPGGVVAAFALYKRSRRMDSENRRALSNAFLWSALGFGLYGLTQIFVTPLTMFPASYINSAAFSKLFGFPIQVVRASTALWITLNLLRALKILGEEREAQFVAARQARLEAMEQVQKEMEAREVMRRELLRHTVMAQEEERARIARELHDDAAQLLTAFSLNLATLQMGLPKKSEMNALANRLQDQSKQLSQGIYRLVHDLRPAQLDDLGLIPAVQYLADQVCQRVNLDVTLQVNGARRRLDSISETVIFRFIQEALTNVERHARVSQAIVGITYNPQEIFLQIQDEGVGFDPNETLTPPHGWGLAGMRERVESVKGKFSLRSAPGRGTIVEAWIPVEELKLQPEEGHNGKGNPFDPGR